MKLCINCKHYGGRPHGEHRCQRPQLGIDPVTGNKAHTFCATERKYDQDETCGREAKHFEAAEIARDAAA